MKKRLDWVDIARGLIVLYVVLYQCTTRVGYFMPSEGVVYWIAELGRPLRMPVLFFISGYLLTSGLSKNFRDFFNAKVIHLIFFFVLWTLIQEIMRYWRLPLLEIARHVFVSLTTVPINSLWFIIVLAAFFMIARLCRDVPPPLMLGIAILLELAKIGPYSIWTDNTTRYFVYFLFGIYGASSLHRLSDYFEKNKAAAALCILIFIALDLIFVLTNLWQTSGLSLLLSSLAIISTVAMAILMQKLSISAFFSFAGRNSLVIYLGYAPFLLVILNLLLKSPISNNYSLLALFSWVLSIGAALSLWFLVRKTPLFWLFERPNRLKI